MDRIDQGGKFRRVFQDGHIHHDRIEVPWNTLGFVHGEENQLQTWTLIWMRRRNAPLWKVFPAAMQAEMAVVAREIEAVLAEDLLPFFKRYANLGEIEMLANVRPLVEYEQYGVGGPLEHRAMRSLLLAMKARSRWNSGRTRWCGRIPFVILTILMRSAEFLHAPVQHRLVCVGSVDSQCSGASRGLATIVGSGAGADLARRGT